MRAKKSKNAAKAKIEELFKTISNSQGIKEKSHLIKTVLKKI